MGLIVLLAWVVALIVAAVVLGFCAYEIVWKSKRLSQDLEGLQEIDERIAGVREQLAVTQDRIAAAKIER